MHSNAVMQNLLPVVRVVDSRRSILNSLMFCAVDRGVFDILCPNDREAAEFCTEDPVGGGVETLEVVVDPATVCMFFKASCKNLPQL